MTLLSAPPCVELQGIFAACEQFEKRMGLFPSQLLEEQTDSLNPVVKIRNVEFLVRSVQVVVGQSKAHHYAGNLQGLVEIVDDGDRPSAADEDRFFLEGIAQRLRCGLDVWIVRPNHARRPFAVYLDFR